MNSVAWGDAPPTDPSSQILKTHVEKVVVEALQCDELKLYWLSLQDYQTDVTELSFVLTLLLIFLMCVFKKKRKFMQHLLNAKEVHTTFIHC